MDTRILLDYYAEPEELEAVRTVVQEAEIPDPDDDGVFFQTGDMVLALWDRAKLAEDSCVEDAPGWGGVTLRTQPRLARGGRRGHRTGSCRGRGDRREPDETFWGGYSSVFLAPEGHPWEIAHNPNWTVTPDGGVRLPEALARPVRRG